MDDSLRAFLEELSRQGEAFDANEADRLKRRRNLEWASAELLWVIVAAMRPQAAMEIGTSNGVSAIWLADARRGAERPLRSVDNDEAALEMARANLSRAGLADEVELVHGDGGAVLRGLSDGELDFLFLDAERSEYVSWWPHPMRVLRPGGLLVIDNVVSHKDEVAHFCSMVNALAHVVSTTVPIGKGLFFAVPE